MTRRVTTAAVMQLPSQSSGIAARTLTDARVKPVMKIALVKTRGVGHINDFGNGTNLGGLPGLSLLRTSWNIDQTHTGMSNRVHEGHSSSPGFGGSSSGMTLRWTR